MTIKCAMPISHVPPKSYHYREKQFVAPRLNHYRLDWCYKNHTGCGLQAANAFCRHRGFLKATSIAPQRCVGATKTVGSQALCFGRYCKGFKYIICYR